MQNTRARHAAEEGFFIVWMALLMTVLLSFAAFGVDIAHWYAVANRIQKAADAAALAGAVHLPGDPTAAANAARDYAARNGFTVGGPDNITVQATQDSVVATRLNVTITENVPNYFAQVIGFRRQVITRRATADYQGPVAMGSPANNFGNEPIGSGDTRWSSTYTSGNQPNFWGNVFGPQSAKGNGDAKQAEWCDTASPDGCAMMSRSAGSNTDYANGGYYYRISVPSAPSGARLRIQAFDPAFANVGDLCDNSTLTGSGVGNPFVSDEGTRYAAGQNAYCTGDQLFTGGSGDSVPPTTTYVVRGPVNGIVDPDTVPVLTTSCSPDISNNQFPGYDYGPSGSSGSSLSSALNSSSGSYNSSLARVFRRWVTLCTVDTPVAGDYLVQVRTNAPLGSPLSPNLNMAGGGANRFAVRAAFVSTGGNLLGGTGGQSGISITGNGYMGLYANVPSGTSTTFYLARVMPGSGGKTLQIKLFDVGDCNPSPGCAPTMRILDKNGTQFAACTESAGPTAPANLTPCSFQAGSSFNAKWTVIDVSIPAGYTCTTSNPLDCWVRITYTPPAGSLLDTTTWTAAILGDPVRLVQ